MKTVTEKEASRFYKSTHKKFVHPYTLVGNPKRRQKKELVP